MRITGITRRPRGGLPPGGWLFVQVATDAGLTGLGEASQGGDDGAVAETIERHLAPWLAGRVPGRGALLAALRLPGGLSGGGDRPLGVEQALWTWPGRRPGSPSQRLLGGRLRPRLWVYANINRSTWERSPRVRRQRQAGGRAGFRAVKLAPFDDVPRLDTPEAFATIALGIDRVLAVREAVGPEVQVLVDCHCHFNAAWAVRVARRLESARPTGTRTPSAQRPGGPPARAPEHRAARRRRETFFGRRPF